LTGDKHQQNSAGLGFQCKHVVFNQAKRLRERDALQREIMLV